MKNIEAMLRRQIGLDSASVGSSLIERAIRLRMKSCSAGTPSDYRALLQSSREEWNALVESVVVAETWFFRDSEPFSAFVHLVQQEWLPENPSKKLRVLSVPCSTGEEPYSLAMALLDAGVPQSRFVIDAVDLSRRALERAQRAVYGKNSFRGKALDFRARHFSEVENGFALRTEVTQCVQFYYGNLLTLLESAELISSHATAAFGPNKMETIAVNGAANSSVIRPGYDFIFCRNLLIYFDRATQTRAFTQLRELLSERGVLFVGAAEMPLINGNGFVSANLPMSFACRKRTEKSRDTAKKTVTRSQPISPTPKPARENSILSTARSDTPVATGPQPKFRAVAKEKPGSELRTARNLADAGRLEEAGALCEAHLKTNGPSADGFYLLGLIRDAAADPTAIECYRKALYLQPDHYESLVQLALLLEKRGEREEARTLKRRASRVATRAAANS